MNTIACLYGSNTTTDLDPDQIHEIGLKQVAEIEAAMAAIAKQSGYSDLTAFRAALRTNRQQYATSREQILDLYRKYTDEMYGKLDQLFGHLPKARLSVMPVEEFREKEASTQYYPGVGGRQPERADRREHRRFRASVTL